MKEPETKTKFIQRQTLDNPHAYTPLKPLCLLSRNSVRGKDRNESQQNKVRNIDISRAKDRDKKDVIHPLEALDVAVLVEPEFLLYIAGE